MEYTQAKNKLNQPEEPKRELGCSNTKTDFSQWKDPQGKVQDQNRQPINSKEGLYHFTMKNDQGEKEMTKINQNIDKNPNKTQAEDLKLKSRVDLPSNMNYFFYKFLDQDSKLLAIKRLPTIKIRRFYAQEFLEKIANRLNFGVEDKITFLRDYKLSMYIDKKTKKLRFKKKKVISRARNLFGNRDFYRICKDFKINILSGKKTQPKMGLRKVISSLRKSDTSEASRQDFEVEGTNFRFNFTGEGSNLQYLLSPERASTIVEMERS